LATKASVFSLFLLALSIPFSIAGDNGALALGLVALAARALSERECRRRLTALLRDPVFLSALAVVATALLSVFLSQNKARALRDWKSYWVIGIYAIVACLPRGALWRRKLFWTLFFSSSLSALVALVQHYGGIHLGPLRIAPKHRSSSTLFVMTFAGIFYQLIALNFSQALCRGLSTRSRLLLAGGLALQIPALLFSLIRGAFLALLFALTVPGLLLRERRAVATGLLLVTLVGVALATHPLLRWRVHRATEDIAHPRDRSIATRYVLWDVALEMIAEHPLLGVGMGDFSIEAQKRLRGRPVRSTTDAHDIYLHVLATRGIVGFVPFVLFWVFVFKRLRSVARSAPADSFTRHLALGVIAATVALLIGALTENNIDDSEVFIAFLFLFSLAAWAQEDD